MPSEFELIEKYLVAPTPGTLLGPGDDCALITPAVGATLAVTTDTLVSGVHFFPDVAPDDLAWKTLAVNLSDLAAMGASPRWVTLCLTLPEADEHWLRDFSAAWIGSTRHFGVDIIGGDTTRGPLSLSVTAIGEVSAYQALRRDAAKEGDDIWVSGFPGRAALGLQSIRGDLSLAPEWREICEQALLRPWPRIALGQSLLGLAHAAADISDGLLADLGHIIDRSRGRTGHDLIAVLDPLCYPEAPDGLSADVWRSAWLAGGDDYELVFTAPPEHRRAIELAACDVGVPLRRIGGCRRRKSPGDSGHPSPTVFESVGSAGEGGAAQPLTLIGPLSGYDHFRALRPHPSDEDLP